MEAIQDQVILEQFLNILPKNMCIFIKERKPKSSVEASILADDFVQARKSILPVPQTPYKRSYPIKCFTCGKPGHVKKDCLQDPDKLFSEKRPTATRELEKSKRDLKDVKCFNCQQKGHFSADCPRMQCFVVSVE